MALDADLEALAKGKNFAAITTLMPDGQPQTQIIWVDVDADHLVVNTTVGRQKYRNVLADPRITVTVFEDGNPYRYVEARGVVSSTQDGPPAAASIDALSEKYVGGPYTMGPTDERVILFIDVRHVHKNGF